MKTKVIFIMLLSVLSVNSIIAQKSNKKITITGTVVNADKVPIQNAIIMIDGQKTNSLTDENGHYRIKVKSEALKIGFFTFGNGTAEELINGRIQIDHTFGVSASQQAADQHVATEEQGVNTGYGSVKKKNLTTDVKKIDGTNKKYANYSSIAEMLQREVSGCHISGSSVILQDSQNLSGSVPAWIVVDGVGSFELPSFSPITVKSIEVLKGTSAAIYGTNGFGGAIIIKTKLQND